MKCKLSIYLAKKGFIEDAHLADLEAMQQGKRIFIPNTESVIYINQKKPAYYSDWINFILFSQNDITLDDFSKNQSESAMIISRIDDNIFIIPFGSGHHKIKKDSIERDFGLRVTLNSVDSEKLRSLDKSNYQDNPLNTRNQSTKEVDILSLNIDSELEMLSTLTGKSNTPLFGDIITGKDSLTITISENILSLSDILKNAYIKFKSPLPKDFEWIDNISKVKDKELCLVLDSELDEQLKIDNKCLEFWLGEPEIVDWKTQTGYSFDLYKRSEIHPTLSLLKMKSYFKNKNIPFCCENMKNQKIHIMNNDDTSYNWWSAYSCLYAEVENNGELYILRNNTWYLVNIDFAERIDKSLEKIKYYDYELPLYNHDREEDYNRTTSDLDKDLFNLDQKLIIHGGGQSKIEFADIIRNGNEFIHVKHYRSSSTLSHLFSQGYVASELFVSDAIFREKLNKKLPSNLKITDIAERPDTRKYTVIYAIAINRDIPKGLPFFSKITLKNASRSLENLGFNIRIAQIKIDPQLEKLKKLKRN
jgi:uncharacterized protein (TIGR04141 family)